MTNKESLSEQLSAAKEAYINAKTGAVNADAAFSRARSELDDAQRNVGSTMEKVESLHKNLLQERLTSEGLSVCYFANEWTEHKLEKDKLSTKEDLRKLGIIPTEEMTLLFVKTVVGPANFNSMDEEELSKLVKVADSSYNYRDMFTNVYDYDKLDYRSWRDFHAFSRGLIASTTGDIIRVCREHVPNDEVFKKYHLVLENGLASIMPAISIVRKNGERYITSAGDNFDGQVSKIIEKRAKSSESSLGISSKSSPEIWEKSPYDVVIISSFGFDDDGYNQLTLKPVISKYFNMPPIYPN